MDISIISTKARSTLCAHLYDIRRVNILPFKRFSVMFTTLRLWHLHYWVPVWVLCTYIYIMPYIYKAVSIRIMCIFYKRNLYSLLKIKLYKNHPYFYVNAELDRYYINPFQPKLIRICVPCQWGWGFTTFHFHILNTATYLYIWKA